MQPCFLPASLVTLLSILAQQPPGTISGTITDVLTHQPIRSATVTTVAGSRDVSDGDGRYTLKHPTGTAVQIRVALAGYSPLEKTFAFADGDFLRLDLELHPLARIVGRVTDNETGEPVAQVLSVRRVDTIGGHDVLPDKEGRFEARELEPGDYTLGLRQDTDAVWQPSSGTPGPAKPRHSYGLALYPETIHVAEGEQRLIDFRLPPLESHSVTGIVEVPAGREKDPLAFTLWHMGIIMPTMPEFRRPGPFRIDGLTSGEYGLVAQTNKSTGILFARQSFTITDHDAGPLKLTLSPAASVTGTVRMKEENAAIPPILEVWLISASGWGSCSYCLATRSQSQSLVPAGLIRIFQKPIPVAEGRFHGDGIAPDEYWPALFAANANGAGGPGQPGLPDGYAVLTGDDQPIELFGGAQIDFVLTSRPGAIAGVVTDSHQNPVAGTTVTLTPASDPRRQSGAKSGQNGEFLFRNVAPGKYRVDGVPVEVGFGQTAGIVVVR